MKSLIVFAIVMVIAIYFEFWWLHGAVSGFAIYEFFYRYKKYMELKRELRK